MMESTINILDRITFQIHTILFDADLNIGNINPQVLYSNRPVLVRIFLVHFIGDDRVLKNATKRIF